MITEDRHRCGVVIGKFNPPHLGHLFLIETAAARVERLFVLVCDRQDQSIPATQRCRWLEEVVPANVSVLITPDDLPAANEPWATRTLEILPEPPDLAFTSEGWGAGWAALMGAEHVMVDLDRRAFPVSGTALRSELRANFEWLLPPARAALVRRVVVIGAKSSGKSTLAESLAAELGTVWIPEHGRWYWEGRRHLKDQSWSSDEFVRIAQAQQRLEADLARKASRGVSIADTDALVTAVWHERYLGVPNSTLDALAEASAPDLYVVCRPDFGWAQDGTRESEDHRDAMQASMERRARVSGADVVVLSGSHELRMAKALAAINAATEFEELI